MKSMTKRSFLIALMLGAAIFTTSTLSAADKKLLNEDELIAELAGPNEDKVANAMVQLEKRFPAGGKALPAIKKLLTDPREKVRRKAVRVLGVLHAEVDATDLKNITAMFAAKNPLEVIDALKGLIGLKAESTIPEILPLLRNPTRNVVRDAVRTMASLGNKSHIPSIEPLLQHSDAAVKKEAADAIFALQKK